MDFEMFAYVGRKMRLCTLALAKQLGLARFEGSASRQWERLRLSM